MSEVDKVVPGDKWEFDESVTKCFNDMLARSIPSYEAMRALTFQLMDNHHRQRIGVSKEGSLPAQFKMGNILDLGASRGEALRPFAESGVYNCTAVEVSQPMLEALHEQYAANPLVDIRNVDMRKEGFISNELRTSHLSASFSGILSILTIQFTPIEYRLDIIQEVYDCLEPGGMFIFVEKVLGHGRDINRLMVDTYYQAKNGNGYSKEDIERKRLSLEGVLVPQTASANEEMLRMAGFKMIDCFYRHLNFAGWVCIK